MSLLIFYIVFIMLCYDEKAQRLSVQNRIFKLIGEHRPLNPAAYIVHRK